MLYGNNQIAKNLGSTGIDIHPTQKVLDWYLTNVDPRVFTIWERWGSTLTQVMASCLMAPNNYLNQFWLIISTVKFTRKQFYKRSLSHQSPNMLESYLSKFTFQSAYIEPSYPMSIYHMLSSAELVHQYPRQALICIWSLQPDEIINQRHPLCCKQNFRTRKRLIWCQEGYD